jgi:hypothetical protein
MKKILPALVLLAAAAVLAAFAAGVGPFARGPAPRVVGSGPSARSGDFSISSCSFHVVSGSPGIVFGTYASPGTGPAFSYVIVVPASSLSSLGAGDDRGVAGEASVDGRDARAAVTITASTLRIRASHHLVLDRAEGRIAGEALSVGGSVVDPEKGRVFLVDPAARAEPRQVSIALPPAPRDLDSASVEAAARAIVEAAEKDPEARAFLER